MGPPGADSEPDLEALGPKAALGAGAWTQAQPLGPGSQCLGPGAGSQAQPLEAGPEPICSPLSRPVAVEG